MIDSLLLAATRVITFEQQQPLTNASGFFFERDGRLFLVTSRHVLIDEPSKHFPDRIEIELHIEADNMARSIGFSIPLYRDGKSIWSEGLDAGGAIDVAGPVVAGGMLFALSGYPSRGGLPGNVLLAFAVEK